MRTPNIRKSIERCAVAANLQEAEQAVGAAKDVTKRNDRPMTRPLKKNFAKGVMGMI